MSFSEDHSPVAKLPVWVVDDDDVRFSLRFALATHNLNATTYSSGEEFLRSIDPMQPGCVVLDLTIDGILTGTDIQQRLKDMESPIKVVILSRQADIKTVADAMENGAVGFLEKPVDPDVLAEKVLKGLKMSRLAHAQHQMRLLLRSFSRREVQIFELVCRGFKNCEIAERLFLSQRTVEVHRANINRKLDGQAPISVLYELALTDPDANPFANLARVPVKTVK